MRTITDQDIKDAFGFLMNQNATTSTKEVKEYLRNQDFWVLQHQVSSVMNDCYLELGAERNHNGMYYEYQLATIDDDDDIDDDEIDDDDDTDDDDDDDDVVITAKVSVFSNRQLKFRKDSNGELLSKFRNPKYTQFKSDIQAVLNKRGVTV